MKFEEILSDIEALLIGKALQSINPSTAPIYLIKIDRLTDKYFVSTSPNDKGSPRSINELRSIWEDLNRKGFASVEQALYGGGSSRNQPETIFANLPYIQHFKFRRKKHILLRHNNVHDAGTISEVMGADFRKIRKQIENYLELTFPYIIRRQKSFLGSINRAFDIIASKYPGEAAVIQVNSIFKELDDLNKKISDAVVSVDNVEERELLDGREVSSSENLKISIEDRLETSDITGIDEGDFDKDQHLERKIKDPKLGITRIRQLTPVLSLIYDRIQFGDIDLQPDFQRKDRIWKLDKKAKLIESILMRLPLPAFYFAEKTDGTWIVVDGLQRITTVYDFMRGMFPLQDLNVLDYNNGNYFKDLTRGEQREIREYAITLYLIDMESDKSNMIVELFHRINTYGVKLSGQEIRSALHQGSSVRFLKYIVSQEIFKSTTLNKVSDERQKDMELCLSALSFMVLGYKNYKDDNYNDFLSEAMDKLNHYKINFVTENSIESNSSKISESCFEFVSLYNRYEQALKLAKEVFGEYAFVKDFSSKRAPISKQLYELVIYYFSLLDIHQKNTVLSRGASLLDELQYAIKFNSIDLAVWNSKTYIDTGRGFRDAISTSTGKNVTVRYRFEAFAEILKRSTGIIVKNT